MSKKNNNKKLFVKHIERVIDGEESITSKEYEIIGYSALVLGLTVAGAQIFKNPQLPDMSVAIMTLSSIFGIATICESDVQKNKEVQKTLYKSVKGNYNESRKK